MASEQRSNPRDTPRHTPSNSRSYLNLPHSIRQSPQNTGTPHMIQETNSNASEDTGVIYGTNISTKNVIGLLQRFILSFDVVKNIDNDTITQKIYHNQLIDLDLLQLNTFEVSGVHLMQFDRQLYYQFVYFPAQMISCFDYVLRSLYERYFVEPENDLIKREQKELKCSQLMMGIKHLDEISYMRNLTTKDINKLICFRGIVIRSSEIYPEMKCAFFRCTECKYQIKVVLENAKVNEPTNCAQCHKKHTFEIIHNLCEFTDKQFVKFQELPEYVPEGETPNSLTILCYDSNVDGMRAGDRVQVVGIYRAQAIKLQRVKSNLKSVFNIYIDLISFRILEDNRFKVYTGELTNFNDQDKRKFVEMADKDSIIDDLIGSFAPSIYGHEEIKRGILAQLFGGATKNFSASGRGRFRTDINICLIGDPSTAKSQLLQQVYKISPRGIYTSGRGSSAVGLTANIRKDPQTRQFILQSGALVLSDLGICCIDEFDKMDQNSRTILLEAMEQQTISIAKAGIVCQLNSRTAILSAANPVNSKYDQNKSVVENINLTPALLSRFDLIYIMLDQPNHSIDRNLATHILSIYSEKSQKSINQGIYPRDLLARYITYAKEYVHPIITEAAGKKLTNAYIEMRQMGNNKKTITATPRQLQSLIRISESFAKMRLSKEVSDNDVEQAIGLIKVATHQAATDPVTGLIDMDIITTGKTTNTKLKISKIVEIAKQILMANVTKYKKNTNMDKLIPQVEKILKQSIKNDEMVEALKQLEIADYIALTGQNKHNPQFRIQRDDPY